jgi:hypothetical protein
MQGTMEEYHPSPDMLERFLRGTLEADDCRVLVRHLLTGCPVCRAVTGRLWRPGGTAHRGRPRVETMEEEPLLAVVD